MADDCLPQIHACLVRVADLEPNGVPKPGPNHLYVTGALATVTLNPVYRDGSSIEEEDGCGSLAVAFEGEPSYKWDEVEITLLKREPMLEAMLTKGVALTLGGDTPKGWAAPQSGPVRGAVSVEFWSKRLNGPDVDPDFPYAWWALPKVRNLRRGQVEHGNSAQKPTFTGIAVENPNWFDGPLNDWPAASDRAVQWVPTTVLPEATCGAQTLAAS